MGEITETTPFGATIIDHKVRFRRGDLFHTSGDVAVPVEPYVRLFDDAGNLLLDAEGNPCSFWVHEVISSIPRGSKTFKHVTWANIAADGYISMCPTDNTNSFVMSGEVCLD